MKEPGQGAPQKEQREELLCRCEGRQSWASRIAHETRWTAKKRILNGHHVHDVQTFGEKPPP